MTIRKFTLIGVSLCAIVATTYAQNGREPASRKPLNNPMYSTHNYKHPQLAAAARTWEKKKGVAVNVPKLTDADLANYKRQMPLGQPVGGIVVEHTPSANLSDRNYKIQRISEPKSLGPASEYYVKKEQRKPGAIGE